MFSIYSIIVKLVTYGPLYKKKSLTCRQRPEESAIHQTFNDKDLDPDSESETGTEN